MANCQTQKAIRIQGKCFSARLLSSNLTELRDLLLLPVYYLVPFNRTKKALHERKSGVWPVWGFSLLKCLNTLIDHWPAGLKHYSADWQPPQKWLTAQGMLKVARERVAAGSLPTLEGTKLDSGSLEKPASGLDVFQSRQRARCVP